MKKAFASLKGVVPLLILALLIGRAAVNGQRKTTADTTAAAVQFLASLTVPQRAKASFSFDDPERFDWWFVPRVRKGLTIKEMTPPQRQLAQGLVKTALSARGFKQTDQIMNTLEAFLKETEGPNSPNVRDTELYYLSVFGTPGNKEPWGWRFEGHHVSMNFTVVGGVLSAWTPDFRGANPAEVMTGPHQGLRVLAGEEDKAFDLLHSLDAAQQKTALIPAKAPNEIVTSNHRNADLQSPAGLLAANMSSAQKKMLRDLIGEYASRMVDEVAVERLHRIDAAGFDQVGFVWIGADALHQPHYYRVQGPTFLIEFDNVQGRANHIHSVWRDFTGDWGEDVLKEHYQTVAHTP